MFFNFTFKYLKYSHISGQTSPYLTQYILRHLLNNNNDDGIDTEDTENTENEHEDTKNTEHSSIEKSDKKL